jgi:hypothetical protein
VPEYSKSPALPIVIAVLIGSGKPNINAERRLAGLKGSLSVIQVLSPAGLLSSPR